MYKLSELSNPRMAQAFVDYMATQGVELKLVPEQTHFSLYVVYQEQLRQAQQEFALFLDNPAQEKYLAASWQVAQPKSVPFSYPKFQGFSALWKRTGGVTLTILCLTLAIFIAQNSPWGMTVFEWLHFPEQAQQQWQLWRWFSHALLHFSVVHIVFNSLWWWQLGSDIEHKLGVSRLLRLFLLSAACSGLAQFYSSGAYFGGLSGVVYALLGYLWLLGKRAPELGVAVPNGIARFMLLWLVIGYIQPFIPIANEAHLFGLIVGLVLGYVDVWLLSDSARKTSK